MGKGNKKKSSKEKDGDKSEGGEEKPLPKLVLKVGKEHKKIKELKGEISDASNHSENEHTSHHKKKKKKHKHKTDEEKKSKKRELPAEFNENETPSKKLHLRISKEKEKKPVPKEPELSSFQLCLENLHRNLQRKDVYNIFQMPVSDAVAPGYSQVIKNPMDFLTMSQKIERNEYSSIEDFRDDFVLMCNNAMIYNGPDTIYYKSADKMKSIGMKMMSKEKIKKLNKSLKIFVSDSEDDVIQIEDETSDVNIDLINSSAEEFSVEAPPKKKSDKKKKESQKQKQITESIIAAAHKARQRLLEAHPKQLYGYLSKDKEGNPSLNVLNPDVTEDAKPVPVTLEKLAPKPKNLVPPTQSFNEDKKNKTIPVNYLLYGPYGSFGPTYDTSLSNVTKEESDLLLQRYGTELGVSYSKSLQSFMKDTTMGMDYVDRILDSVTGGAHSKFVKEQKEKLADKMSEENKDQQDKIQSANASTNIATNKESTTSEVDIESLLTLDGLGIDVSFLKDLVPAPKKDTTPEDSGKSLGAKELLSENAQLLGSLKDVQYKRLSTKSGGVEPISESELKIAMSITDNLKEMMKVTTPKDVVSEYGVRKAIGVGKIENDTHIPGNVASTSSVVSSSSAL